MIKLSKSDIYQLHRKYAGGRNKEKFLDLIWTHSQIVCEIASRIVEKLKKEGLEGVDLSLMEKGALIHDIGVYGCFEEDLNQDKNLPPYISHGHTGYALLKKEGYSEQLARFALTHTGTGITVEDIKRESFPFKQADYIPVTLEEEIVCYADKFHTKYPSFNTYEEQKARLEKFDSSKGIVMERFKKKFGVPVINDLISKYAVWHKEFDNYYASLQKS